ncbi:MAG: zf-HC2 domain-containing protein [Gemmatimonadales bacterium]
MAECSELLANMSDYLDGLLDRRVARRFEVHLTACPACRAQVAAWRRGVAALQDTAPVAPSPFFRERLAARLEREVRIGDPIQPTSAGFAAALLIGVAVGVVLLEPVLASPTEVPVVAERTPVSHPFAPGELPDVTLAFTHEASPFSSSPTPAGTLALFAR